MANNAQWQVGGLDQHGSTQILYLSSPDLKNTREARRRAAKKAKDRWARKGLKVAINRLQCVG